MCHGGRIWWGYRRRLSQLGQGQETLSCLELRSNVENANAKGSEGKSTIHRTSVVLFFEGSIQQQEAKTTAYSKEEGSQNKGMDR
jgi:hypothetical protein